MRQGFKFWILLLTLLTCAKISLAQSPRFPLPANSEKRVEQEIKKSFLNYGKTEEFVKSIVPRYKAMKERAPAHPLSCDGANQDFLTEERWKFDSRTAMFGKPIPGSANSSASFLITEKFLGCFEQTQKVDLPGLPIVGCIPVPNTPYEICNDPPPGVGNCCANNKEILEKGSLPWTVRIGLALQRNFIALAMLSPFYGAGCNLSPPEKYSNLGYHTKYWWPENEIEVQNYERTVFNPLYECGNNSRPNSFKHSDLTQFLRDLHASLTVFSNQGAPNSTPMQKKRSDVGASKLEFDPDIGESHWAGLLPGDQTFVGEAHVYRTYADVLTSLNYPGDAGTQLGYKRDCACFYTGMQDQKIGTLQRKTVNGWTEQDKYLPYWRYWQLSKAVSEKRYEALEKFQSYDRDSCAFLRAWDEWAGGSPIGGPRMPNLNGYGYRDLYKAVSTWPPPAQDPIRLRKELLRICYRGGGDLFPVTGQLIGHFSPLPASAYLARRALLLFGTKELKINGKPTDPEFIPKDRRINRYSDKDDKMQRIYPLKGGGLGDASECFRGHEIPNYLQETKDDNWPRDLIKDALAHEAGGPLDTPRFLHWNKRGTCMCPYLGKVRAVRNRATGEFIACAPNGPSCRKTGDDNDYDYDDIDRNPNGILEGDDGHNPKPSDPRVNSEVNALLGDGIPFPFMPEYGAGGYVTDPIRGSDPATWQIVSGRGGNVKRGQCELTKKRNGLHDKQPEDLEDIRSGKNRGGIQCRNQEGRCPGGITNPGGGGSSGGAGGGSGESESTGEPEPTCQELFVEQEQCRLEIDRLMSLTDAEEAQVIFDNYSRTPGAPGTVYVGRTTNPENPDESFDSYLCSYSLPSGQTQQKCPTLLWDGDIPTTQP